MTLVESSADTATGIHFSKALVLLGVASAIGSSLSGNEMNSYATSETSHVAM